MKTLKFMLAAATAIGLASATQADEYNTTGFEKLTVGTNVTTGVKDNDTVSYFYYAGSVPEDNESTIIAASDVADPLPATRPRGAAAVDPGRDKVLQVSTGIDPLMRTYAPIAGGAPQAASTLTGDVYVDTLVQFTVTPYTDTVTPGENDKLMIYLKETTNNVEATETSTNLVVVGGYLVSDGVFEAKEYTITGVDIEPNTWHRLTVKVIANYGELDGYEHPAFQVFLDGDENPCVFDSYAAAEDNTDTGFVAPFDADEPGALGTSTIVFSLLADGSTAATLQGVGFSGEGKVDDIVYSTVDPFATVFDFTFAAFDTEKITAIEYTVGGTSYSYARNFPEVEAGTPVVITSITYADDAMADAITASGLREDGNNTFAVTNAGASLTITAKDAYASVGGEKYDSFTDAFAAAASAGGTVKLVRNLTGSTPMGTTVAAAQSAILDLNGKTIVTDQGNDYWTTIAGTLVVTDSTAQANGKIESHPSGSTLFKVTGTFTLAAGTLDMTTVNPANTAAGFNLKAADATAYVTGGTVLGRIKAGDGGNVYMTGGSVDIIAANEGHVTISGGTVTGAIEGGTAGTAVATDKITIPALVNSVTNTAQFGTNEFAGVAYTAFLDPASGYTLEKAEGSEWYMVAGDQQQQDDWVEDSSTITPGTTAAEQYSALAGTALATADAKELTDWAKTNSIAFAGAAASIEAAPTLYTEAFLLNCAPEASAVAAEKDDFVLEISIDASGDPVVTTPEDRGEKDYNGTVTIKGATTVNGTYEADLTDKKFFKAELSL